MDVKERRMNVEKLYKSGTKTEKIAKLLGISVRTIERDIAFLQAHNKEKTGKTAFSVHAEIILRREKEKRREDVARLYKEEKSAKEIAEELGVSLPTIYQDIRTLIEEGKIEKRQKN